MNRFRPRRPSPAMTVALLALFVALGGTGYAALKLPKNSVGAKQIKKNAVRSGKVKNRSLKGADIRLSTLGKVPSAKSADVAARALGAPPSGPAGGALAGTYPAPRLRPMEATHHVDAAGEPPFVNGWANEDPTDVSAGFYRDPYGIVHIQGAVQRATGSGGEIFFLPPAYRPGKNAIVGVWCNSGLQIVVVRPNGEVSVTGPFVQSCTLDGVTFRFGET
jgi:hypothetical protein